MLQFNHKMFLSAGSIILFFLWSCGGHTAVSTVKNEETPRSEPSSDSWDGCYSLWHVSETVIAEYSTVCLSGTSEEGVGGAGVRLAVFSRRTLKLIQAGCMKSSASGLEEDGSFSFTRDSKKELILTTEEKDESGLKMGKAQIGQSKFKFVQLDAKAFSQRSEIMHRECLLLR